MQFIFADCPATNNPQNGENYANTAKEIFEKSQLLSIVPQLLEMAQVKELIPIMKEVEVKKDKSLNDYLMLNEIYEKLGEPEKQVATLTAAVQSSPEDPRPLLLLATKKLDRGERDGALELFRNYLNQSQRHPGQIYLMSYVFALIYPISSVVLLIGLIWLLAYFMIYYRKQGAQESFDMRIGIATIFFLIPPLLGIAFVQTTKALPFGALILIFLGELFWLIRPGLRKIYQPVVSTIGKIIYFVFNGILLAKKLDQLSSAWRVIIALLTLTFLSAIAPTIQIPDLKYAVIAFCAFLFYSTLGSLLVSFIRSRVSLLSSLRWIAIAATLPFLISYLISNWATLGAPLFYARLPAEKSIDSLAHYLVFWGVSLVLSLHLGKIIAEALIEPIRDIIEKVARIEKGEFQAKVNVFSRDEIGTLGHAINRMGSGLERREKIEKTFHQYIDKQIAERILDGCENEVRIEGKSTQAVVMFADIRGYTALSEKAPANEVVKLLNEFFERTVKIVKKYDGVVDKYIGDNLMAVWGVPYPTNNAEEKAVAAALAMLTEMQQWNAELEKKGNPPLGVGIGLNSGVVIAGSLGSSEHMEYTVIGDVVNTAQRAEALAKKQELLITESVYQVLKDKIEASPLEPIKVKGKEAMQVFWQVSAMHNSSLVFKDDNLPNLAQDSA